jgi:DNA-binding transcriptional LysR family regulator
MTLDGRRLQYFLTVADLGSLGRAAGVLHVAQPALSRQMRLLEEEVGATLMERTARGMALTAAGRAYYQSAQRLLADGTAAAVRARGAARGDAGHLSVGFSEIYAWHPEVLQALQTYRRESPQVTFTIEAQLSGAVSDRVLDGHLDVALAYTGLLEAGGPLQSAPWMIDEYRLAVPIDSPYARRPPRRLADLNGEDFVLFRRDQSPRLHDLLIHHFHQRGFSPHIVQEGTTHYTVLALVAAGLGCSVMPSSAEPRVPPGVKLVRVPDMRLFIPVDLVWRKDHHTPAVQRLVDLLCGVPVDPARRGLTKRPRGQAASAASMSRARSAGLSSGA